MATFKDAVDRRDAEALSPHLDNLRHAKGLNSQQIYDIAHKVTGVSVADWDQLMYDVDELP